MKFFLVKDLFTEGAHDNEITIDLTDFEELGDQIVVPFMDSQDEAHVPDEIKQSCAKVKKLLASLSGDSDDDDDELFDESPLKMKIVLEPGVAKSWENGCLGIPGCKLIEELVQLFGDNLTVQVTLELYEYIMRPIINKWRPDARRGRFSLELSASTGIMRLRKGARHAFQETGFPHGNEELAKALNRGSEICANVSVIVEVNDQPDAGSQLMKITQTMLRETQATDLEIIPGTGEPVKCHKCFLIAQSFMFRIMCENKMKEAKTIQLKMPGMSEAGVKALLAYLYCREETEPDSKCAVAFELLIAGRKYAISDLEAAMRKLLLSKEDQWFTDMDVVIKLFQFASNLQENGEELKRKAAKVLRENLLAQSTVYQTLFKESPEVASELKKFMFNLDDSH